MPTILVYPAEITNEGKLDKESLVRLKRGFREYEKLIKKGTEARDIYFVSSVQDRLNEGLPSQSEMTKKILIQWGVPSEQIITSNQSSFTIDDVYNSFQLIKSNNLSQPIINVSSWYHIPRIRLIWYLFRKKFNYPEIKYVSAGFANYFWIFLEPRETFKTLRRFRQLKDNI